MFLVYRQCHDTLGLSLARAVGHPEWIEDPRFASAADRAQNAETLIAELDAAFATRAGHD